MVVYFVVFTHLLFQKYKKKQHIIKKIQKIIKNINK